MMQMQQELMQRLAQARERDGGGNLIERLRAAKAGKPRADLSHLDDPDFWRRIGAAPVPVLDTAGDEEAEPAPECRRPARKPPRMDPMRTACRMIAKNPNLVAVIRPNGEFEIRAAAASAADIAPSLDAGADDEVWNAIQAIRGH